MVKIKQQKQQTKTKKNKKKASEKLIQALKDENEKMKNEIELNNSTKTKYLEEKGLPINIFKKQKKKKKKK